MSIAFVDLAAQQARLEPLISDRMQAVLAHGKYIMGPEVAELEAALAERLGVAEVVTCASGTDALLLPLMAWGIGPGDAVFAPPFTFIATVEVASLLGATPVFVDVDPETFNMDPAALDAAIARVTNAGELTPKCVIAVDLFGQPADYTALQDTCDRHGVRLLEDAAQSLGGSHVGLPAGSFGDAAATSFFPAKPLGAYGDGGAVFTNDASVAEVLRSIRVHGSGAEKYDNVRVGLNARLDTLQAAILLAKLTVFDDEIARRQVVADNYHAALSDVVRTPVVKQGNVSAWAQYSIVTEQRDAVQAALKAANIPCAIYYPTPLHLQTAYRGLGGVAGDFPVSEQLSGQILSLPMHPYLTESDQGEICDAVRSAFSGTSARQ